MLDVRLGDVLVLVRVEFAVAVVAVESVESRDEKS